jgi:penicillin-binding protein 1A
MLAGLPKAPSAFNPVANPKRAQLRQRYVLRRMHELNFINDAQWKSAQAETLHVKRDVNDFGVHAEHVAEMARQIVVESFPGRGVQPRPARDHHHQPGRPSRLHTWRCAAGVMDYDRRHGYRGAEAYVDMTGIDSNQDEALEEHLSDYYDSDDLLPAIVLEAGPKLVRAYLRGGEVLKISDDGLKFAARMLDDKAAPNKRIRRGAVIRVQKGRQRLADRPAAGSRGGIRRRQPGRRRSPGAGRRLRFQSQQVQPHHPGLAPAGLQLQALHLLRGTGKGLYPGVGDRG